MFLFNGLNSRGIGLEPMTTGFGDRWWGMSVGFAVLAMTAGVVVAIADILGAEAVSLSALSTGVPSGRHTTLAAAMC
jgi:hypothetical protein